MTTIYHHGRPCVIVGGQTAGDDAGVVIIRYLDGKQQRVFAARHDLVAPPGVIEAGERLALAQITQ